MRTCVLVLLTAGLVIILQVLSSVSWGPEWDVFKFGYRCAIVLLLGQAMYSVRLYPFIPYTTTAHTYYMLRSAFTTLLVSDRLFAAILMEVRPPPSISITSRKLIVEPRHSGEAQRGVRGKSWPGLVGAGFPADALLQQRHRGLAFTFYDGLPRASEPRPHGSVYARDHLRSRRNIRGEINLATHCIVPKIDYTTKKLLLL